MKADNILGGLNSPLSDERITTLKAIRQQPAQAESACKDAGEDIIGLLLELCKKFSNSSEKWEYLFTTLSFADGRTAKLAKDVFISSTENKYLVMAANRISQMTDMEKSIFLPPILFADNNKNRTRLCANLLAGNTLINAKTAIRISAISDKNCLLPAINKDTIEFWIDEMQGPYTQSIRKKFLELKDKPTDLLLTRWESMNDSLKEWLLDKVIKSSPYGYETMLVSILNTETSLKVLLSAMNCVRDYPNPDIFQNAIGGFLNHENEKIRAHAVLCCTENTVLANMMADEKSPEVTANIISQLSSDEKYMLTIAPYFSSPHWKVRAAATQAMVNLAPMSVDTLKSFFYSDDINVRTSAIKCLTEIGMEEWIENNIHSIQ